MYEECLEVVLKVPKRLPDTLWRVFPVLFSGVSRESVWRVSGMFLDDI